FINDVVAPLARMAYQNDVIMETINIGPDEEFITINQLAEVLAKLLDFNLQPVYMPGRPQEVKHATCSADNARAMLGYKTTTSLEDGPSSMIEYIKMRGTKPFHYHLDLEIVSDKTPRTWKDRLF